MAILYILGGLPGVGKSTIARLLSHRTRATWLRIDTIEHSLVKLGLAREDIGGKGYELAYAIAADNLLCGQSVVADSVNPIAITREAWRRVASGADQDFLEIEISTSDRLIHQRRVERRISDIPGFIPSSWEYVLNRDYAPWPEAMLRIDTARFSSEEAVDAILRAAATK